MTLINSAHSTAKSFKCKAASRKTRNVICSPAKEAKPGGDESFTELSFLQRMRMSGQCSFQPPTRMLVEWSDGPRSSGLPRETRLRTICCLVAHDPILRSKQRAARSKLSSLRWQTGEGPRTCFRAQSAEAGRLASTVIFSFRQEANPARSAKVKSSASLTAGLLAIRFFATSGGHMHIANGIRRFAWNPSCRTSRQKTKRLSKGPEASVLATPLNGAGRKRLPNR
jgi:hypothetical protein